jgi:hypothetical protein
MSVIIIAEGARDTKGKQITANEVKDVIEEDLKMEARVTILGHIQRGGTPCFYDRLLVSVCTNSLQQAYWFLEHANGHGCRGSYIGRKARLPTHIDWHSRIQGCAIQLDGSRKNGKSPCVASSDPQTKLQCVSGTTTLTRMHRFPSDQRS